MSASGWMNLFSGENLGLTNAFKNIRFYFCLQVLVSSGNLWLSVDRIERLTILCGKEGGQQNLKVIDYMRVTQCKNDYVFFQLSLIELVTDDLHSPT